MNRRRMAQDHAALRDSPPPDYFFLNEDGADDLTILSLYLVGPATTPYESGLFNIFLRLPKTYPLEPPVVFFHTKIFHPNVNDKTGAVCVDTLKRDWHAKLTLKDVLNTVRCLLIFPNPASALNEAAGKLLLDSYDRFATQARLMTEIHAPVSPLMATLVEETRKRDAANDEKTDDKTTATGKLASTINSNTPKKPVAPAPRKMKPDPPASKTIVTRKVMRPPAIPKAPVGENYGSGKENEVTRERDVSPGGTKRSYQTSAIPGTDPESGRKSPKLKEGAHPTVGERGIPATPIKPKISLITRATPGNRKPPAAAGKNSAKLGLRRF